MNAQEVKRALSGISPQSDVAKAIVAVINGLRLTAVDHLQTPPTPAGINTREFHCGGLAYLAEARDLFRDSFAPSVSPPPPDSVDG